MFLAASVRRRTAILACALILGAPLAIGSVAAQQASPTPPQGAPATPAAPAPAATPASPAPAANPPAAAPSPTPPANPPAATPPASPTPPATPPAAGAPSDESSSGQLLAMTARPAAYIEGKANWTDGFGALTGAIGLIKAAVAKSDLKEAGRPIAVFTETDDSGFSYRAMVPIDKAPEGKTALSDAIKIGQTPAGKAMKFEHRGSYEDIDSTYEAITAYLDEKGLEADNLFVEEYLNDIKAPDDPNLQVDIYVLLK